MAPTLKNWTPTRLARQDGKTFVVTGANSGIGFEAAKVLASQGGRVVLLCRSPQRAAQAANNIRPHMTGGASVDIVPMDMGHVTSIREGAEEVARTAPKIDALIANAGVMAPPQR